jgi:regulator of sigma E protease
MEIFGVNLSWVLPFVVVLTVLVFVHELGHYWIARINKVRVEVFSVGFGPEIWGRTDKHGTRWKISWIPLGGYVKMFGENDFEKREGETKPEMSEADRAVSFHSKTLGQRAAIVFAGPAANYIFAIVVFFLLFAVVGEMRPLAGVGQVDENSAAATAGLEPGDRIVRIDDREIITFSDLQDAIQPNPGVPLRMTVLRDGAEQVLAVTPSVRRVESATGEVTEFGLLGVRPDAEQYLHERRDPLTASWMAVERTGAFTMQILQVVGGIITGNHSAKDLGGPLRIAQMSGEIAERRWTDLIPWAAILSINLGLINLFPIPMLDGGHLAFYIVEAIRGRPLGPRAQEIGFRFGFLFVIALFVFVTWNDLVQLKFIEFIRGLFI